MTLLHTAFNDSILIRGTDTMQIQSTLKKTPIKQQTPAPTTSANTELPVQTVPDEFKTYEHSGLHGEEKAIAEQDSKLQKFKKWFTSIKVEETPEGAPADFKPKRHASPMMKTAYGAVLAAGAWTAVNIATDLASTGSPAALAGKVALNAGMAVGGYLAADVASGVLHHWADNYANPDSKNKLVQKFSRQAHRHHFHPTRLGNYTPAAWAAPLSFVAWAPLVAGNVLGLPAPLMTGALAMTAGMTHYGNFHYWSHQSDKKTPKIGHLLRKMNLAVERKNHMVHHKVPWNSDFCIVNGAMNKPLNAMKFWPRYEKAVHALTGAEPESWKMPEYKAYVDGEITKEEYVAQSKTMRKRFVREEMDERREKWGINKHWTKNAPPSKEVSTTK